MHTTTKTFDCTRRAFIAGMCASFLPVLRSRSYAAGSGFERARQRIAAAVGSGEATGVAVAVTQKGHIIWEEGFGWADQERARKVTSHTPFCLASVTKPFTTTLLMTLAAEGKLSLDDPASHHFADRVPRGPNGNPVGATIRRLGAHAGGLPTIFEQFFPDHGPAAPSTEGLLRSYGALAFPPNESYEYSNVGYAMLGAIAEQVTGREFGTLMTERILRPLGMNDSFFGTDEDRLETRALFYAAAGKVVPYYTTSTPPSGELYVSAHDIARFAMFNLNHSMGASAAILDRRALTELHKPVFSGPAGSATTFGWFRGRTNAGLDVVFKSGGQVGVATTLYMIPARDLSCAVLTNRSDNSGLVQDLASQILRALIPDWDMPAETPDRPGVAFVVHPEQVGRWEGPLVNNGADMSAVLEIAADSTCKLSLGDNAAESVTRLQRVGSALTGNTVGRITAPDAIRTEATQLGLKLIPAGDRWVGRVLASSREPGTLLPFVLTLARRT